MAGLAARIRRGRDQGTKALVTPTQRVPAICCADNDDPHQSEDQLRPDVSYGKSVFRLIITEVRDGSYTCPSGMRGFMEGDYNYFSQRAQEERLAAMKAPHPTARQVHLELADRYAKLANAIAANQNRFATDTAGATGS